MKVNGVSTGTSWTWTGCSCCFCTCSKCNGLRVVKDEKGAWQVCPECKGEGHIKKCPCCPCIPWIPYPYYPYIPYYPPTDPWIITNISYETWGGESCNE